MVARETPTRAQVPARPPPPRPRPAPAAATAARRLAREPDDRLAGTLRRAVLARAKSEQQRGEAARRRTKALATIALLGDNLNDRVDAHMFRGVPLDGSDVDKDAPQGLHAYTNGALPAGMVESARTGARSKIHTIQWHYTGKPATTAKPSTMFPSWMPASHVRTLIALDFPDTREDDVDEDQLHAAEARRWIGREQGIIRVSKIGAGANQTYYPRYQ